MRVISRQIFEKAYELIYNVVILDAWGKIFQSLRSSPTFRSK